MVDLQQAQIIYKLYKTLTVEQIDKCLSESTTKDERLFYGMLFNLKLNEGWKNIIDR